MNTTEQLREKSWEREYPVFKEWQKKLTEEKINQYGFDVTIQNTRQRRLKINHMNTGSGFENAHIDFKGSYVATIQCSFNDSWKEPKIEYMWVRHHWKSFIEEINSSRDERKLPLIEFKRDGHQTLQTCLDELEKLRIEIVNHFSK